RITPRPLPALPPPRPPQVVVVEEDEGDRWMADQPTVSLTLDAIRDSIPSLPLPPVSGPGTDSSGRHPALNGHVPGAIPIPPSNSGIMPIPGASIPGVARPAVPDAAASNPAASAPNRSNPQASAPGAPPPAAENGAFPSQFAPTTLLGRPPAPLNGAPPVPAREPAPEALAPTTRLRPPRPPAPAPPDDAQATVVYDDGAEPAVEAPLAAAASDPGASQGQTQVRIVRKYVVKRARRKVPRKRPPKRHSST
ncbi:MAG TPA: hypothetical protein VGR57_13940, partial [Ktedonobacterales bacterium]|nr:hypothetical protein [Ktedonobacterales bacterium]